MSTSGSDGGAPHAAERPPLEPQRGGNGRRLNSHMVAALAGVSQGTVSNVLNRPEKVASATYDRVMEAIESLGFVPNQSARDLRNGRGSAIGIVVLDVANPFWGELVRGAEEVATRHGRAVIVCSSDGSPEKEWQVLKLLESYQVDCVLIAPVDVASPHLAALRRRGTDVVLLERSAENDGPAIGVDDVLGGRLAAEHLLEMGHRRLAFVNGPHTIASCRDRAQGFLEVFARAGCGAAVTEVGVPTLTAREGAHATDALLRLEPRPTAVFCANDVIALGVLRGLASRGIPVPEQVSIVGYDDADFAALLSPALTTIRIDPMEIGRRAATVALGMSEDADGSAADALDPFLVRRESVRRLVDPLESEAALSAEPSEGR
ncbi:LacI family DNA-binding transcriptional regulator [Amnibacterium sp. CER49]|uniref:LacI family DNA-binding transcriptional regulator n=1 Tax=Amnibacterium sp. CER49 TaxID=3039161 RepID=UPI00244D2541|nr:LacI family DNA-binding transcriptional regulator [Amnibacterium sp. CER49]MDH2443318.1 LacI family DNA-binding transcriptional regulator [Amnibacterium sp. CER49]